MSEITMTVEQVEAFKSFNFWKDERWVDYSKAFDIPLTYEQLPKQQKKWYKKIIDNGFDIDADLLAILATKPAPASQSNQSQAPPQNAYNQPRAPNTTIDLTLPKNRFFKLEGWLKMVFMLLAFINIQFPYHKLVILSLGCFVCYLGMYRMIGNIKLNKEYFQSILRNDFGITIFYILIIISISQLSTLLWLPVLIQFMIGVCNFIPNSGVGFLQRDSILNYCRQVNSHKDDLKKARDYVEFFMMFYFLFMTMFGFYSIVILLIYVHYVKIKYRCNFGTQRVIGGIKDWLKSKWTPMGMFGRVMNKVLDGFFWIISF